MEMTAPARTSFKNILLCFVFENERKWNNQSRRLRMRNRSKGYRSNTALTDFFGRAQPDLHVVSVLVCAGAVHVQSHSDMWLNPARSQFHCRRILSMSSTAVLWSSLPFHIRDCRTSFRAGAVPVLGKRSWQF